MSFDQFPEVDRYSENEDRSNTNFRLHFSQKNGFLVSKPEDKGSDFVIELINNKRSTNWRFPVQLKSIEDPDFIENGTTISYPFEVSRLRYMLESIPPVGLIILYWPENNSLYYDYAELIYSRLLEKREGNMAWKSQEKVKIHIPTINVINSQELQQIHSHIILRHQNSNDRSPSLYPNISIPIESASAPQELQSETNAVDILRSKGLEMYYNNEIPKLSQLLDKMQIKIMREDSRLSLLAGITYWTMGLPVDASFFIETALSNHTITAEDQEHASWTKLWLDNYLGKISRQEYNEDLKHRLQNTPESNEAQRLRYELSIARSDVDSLTPANMVKIFDLANNFAGFNRRIAAANLSAELTVEYYLENVTNLGILLINADSIFRWRIAKEKENGLVIDPQLLVELELFMAKLNNEVEYVFPRIKPLARNFVHAIMLAHCFESQVGIRLKLDLNALRHPLKRFDFQNEAHKSRLLLHTSFAKEALQIFAEHLFYDNAYNMTLMLMELTEFAAYSNVTLNLNLEELHQQAETLRQKLDVGPWRTEAKAVIEAYIVTQLPG